MERKNLVEGKIWLVINGHLTTNGNDARVQWVVIPPRTLNLIAWRKKQWDLANTTSKRLKIELERERQGGGVGGRDSPNLWFASRLNIFWVTFLYCKITLACACLSFDMQLNPFWVKLRRHYEFGETLAGWRVETTEAYGRQWKSHRHHQLNFTPATQDNTGGTIFTNFSSETLDIYTSNCSQWLISDRVHHEWALKYFQKHTCTCAGFRH